MSLFIDLVEPIELALVVIALVAAILSRRNLVQAMLDREATRAVPSDGSVAMWANHTVWSEAIRLAVAVLLAVVGLIVLFLPSAAPTGEIGWLSDMALLNITGVAMLTLIETVHNGETRRLLREALGQQVAAEEAAMSAPVSPAGIRTPS